MSLLPSQRTLLLWRGVLETMSNRWRGFRHRPRQLILVTDPEVIS